MANSVLIQAAYDYIRNQIKLGEFMPGTLLSENELSEKLKMSRTPIRAAISQLEHEGLLVTLKNRGLLVKELSMKEALDILEIIYVFQLHAVNVMEERGESPDLKKLEEYLKGQFEAQRQDAYALYVEYAMKFNRCFIAVLHNNSVLPLMEKHLEKLELYSTINYKITPHEPHYSANRVNQALFDLVVAKDYDGMRKLIKDTFNRNRERTLRLSGI